MMHNSFGTSYGLLFAIVGGIGLTKAVYHFRKFFPLKRRFSLLAQSTHPSLSPPKSRIYTKTGDGGTSSLYNGERRSKVDPIFFALGETDELNACLGIAREHCETSANGLADMLAEIQSRLFDLGAAVATPATSSSESKRAYTQFPGQHTAQLEKWIDALDAQLPPLVNFVLPSGGLSCTHLNLARAVCRRAERACVCLVQDGQTDAEVSKYLNRLSDLLFVASRHAARSDGRTEIIWRKAGTPTPATSGS